MSRGLLAKACILGLLVGSLTELPKNYANSRQSKIEHLLSQTDSKRQSSPQVRASAENELLSEANISDNNEAIAIYQQMLKVNPNSAKTHYLLGKLQLFNWFYHARKLPVGAKLKQTGLNHLKIAKELYQKQGDTVDAAQLERVYSQVEQEIDPRQWLFPEWRYVDVKLSTQ
ncbi:hypothetical protein H6G94_33650 [Nostoc punctiforme FACHB-252]|uniref:Tetratricopeptide repeat protein n=1 Tax=Nostoc punctiforme FACHB-252 TaxID=1357509 RepID=A0ABR8HKU5_NOSPU|nr:hypothetical protein [Nostoc punctiforme]MBD2616133.1 hypothetical protein [Nostoc punctiforme FACHB-252]